MKISYLSTRREPLEDFDTDEMGIDGSRVKAFIGGDSRVLRIPNAPDLAHSKNFSNADGGSAHTYKVVGDNTNSYRGYVVIRRGDYAGVKYPIGTILNGELKYLAIVNADGSIDPNASNAMFLIRNKSDGTTEYVHSGNITEYKTASPSLIQYVANLKGQISDIDKQILAKGRELIALNLSLGLPLAQAPVIQAIVKNKSETQTLINKLKDLNKELKKVTSSKDYVQYKVVTDNAYPFKGEMWVNTDDVYSALPVGTELIGTTHNLNSYNNTNHAPVPQLFVEATNINGNTAYVLKSNASDLTNLKNKKEGTISTSDTISNPMNTPPSPEEIKKQQEEAKKAINAKLLPERIFIGLAIVGAIGAVILLVRKFNK